MTAPARRSRLTPEREGELYEAVIELVREVGYEAMTMDAVAARSRSSKATLYRQWKGKPQLVAAAMRHTKPVRTSSVDTGSLRGDLHELARQIGDAAGRDTAFMNAVGHAVHQNPELAVALREMLIEPERALLDQLVRRAVDRGEIRADAAAVEFFVHMLLGALPARKIVEDRFADADYLSRYVDAVILPALLGS
ncbi:TetR/AcrR family transcriptional regulator [Streptomyces sp. PTM05]|uniref:TetR/AcrR family transcriptional regulator n=1 Tax=Streptantibioticus parmotrematis TaxID=2873249 RepID=A0ABS7QMX2_9ACTN|nr:TetR/AcrR family transcriptional regulator [Streptantibioticus parmotrematis]MBY8884500.1 TetR/AcrR family transcriptional regulator [Streptantibioticus parmotrematis]